MKWTPNVTWQVQLTYHTYPRVLNFMLDVSYDSLVFESYVNFKRSKICLQIHIQKLNFKLKALMKRLPRDAIFLQWIQGTLHVHLNNFKCISHHALVYNPIPCLAHCTRMPKHRKIYFTTLHLRHLWNHATNCQWLHLCPFGSTKVELLGKGFWPKLRHRRWIIEWVH
jgi:hypothetical protein